MSGIKKIDFGSKPNKEDIIIYDGIWNKEQYMNLLKKSKGELNEQSGEYHSLPLMPYKLPDDYRVNQREECNYPYSLYKVNSDFNLDELVSAYSNCDSDTVDSILNKQECIASDFTGSIDEPLDCYLDCYKGRPWNDGFACGCEYLFSGAQIKDIMRMFDKSYKRYECLFGENTVIDDNSYYLIDICTRC